MNRILNQSFKGYLRKKGNANFYCRYSSDINRKIIKNRFCCKDGSEIIISRKFTALARNRNKTTAIHFNKSRQNSIISVNYSHCINKVIVPSSFQFFEDIYFSKIQMKVQDMKSEQISQVVALSTFVLKKPSSIFSNLGCKLKRIARKLLRLCQLALIFAPTIITAPIFFLISKFLKKKKDGLIIDNNSFEKYWWNYLVWAIGTSGPCLIKLMQWASTRRDIFPEKLCHRLEEVQWQVKSHPWEESKAALNTLGSDWDEAITILSRNPIGSGCIAQVYKGKLHIPKNPNSVDVAVKVVHPYIRDSITLDLEIMEDIAKLIEIIPRVHWLSISESVGEFSKLMKAQIDLRNEADNMDRFRKNFANDKNVQFASPIRPFVTDCVLVQSFMEGEPISKYKGKHGKKLANIGLKAFLQMAFLDNLVHGDLHPGNIFVIEGDNGPTLGFLDVGIVTELSKQDRTNWVDLLYSIATGDGKKAGELMIDRSRRHECYGKDREEFIQNISDIVAQARAVNLNLSKIHVGALLANVLALCLKNKVQMESNFVSMVIAIGILEGVFKNLDPSLDLLTAAVPVIIKSSMLTKD